MIKASDLKLGTKYRRTRINPALPNVYYIVVGPKRLRRLAGQTRIDAQRVVDAHERRGEVVIEARRRWRTASGRVESRSLFSVPADAELRLRAVAR